MIRVMIRRTSAPSQTRRLRSSMSSEARCRWSARARPFHWIGSWPPWLDLKISIKINPTLFNEEAPDNICLSRLW